MDTETGWYGYAAPTPAQPFWPEQETAHYAPYPPPYEAQHQQYGYGYVHPEQQYGYAYVAEPQQQQPYYESYPSYEQVSYQAPEPVHQAEPVYRPEQFHEPEPLPEPEPVHEPEPEPAHQTVPAAHVVTGGRAAARAARSRTSRRRSVVLTIAVPTVAVLGIGAAAAGTLAPKNGSRTVAANDASGKLTAADLKAQAEAAAQAKASAEQVSRDKARQALTLRTAAAKKAAAEAPRYVLPITAHTGLSALFGQAGTHWMSLHTGIDFPVSTGTQVHAVTDGTVSTKWNAYYGNMLILTAPDGTQTWYCHLSAYKQRSGTVKAGDVVAYSGDTGNSTGPHLHFEVHPHGGDAIDPLPWLLSHGLDPR
ncbi:M23 family metallopeptidase [Streptacidiphilus cavernicola]|uniref:Peptidoglycan DD-metalloendopeptidase family protein n=1 Tax=Streptacidiphilus cavernicola TaxID=3342716 RepID=A0ABV6VTK6_9ACTN